jgi:hypothetical protein
MDGVLLERKGYENKTNEPEPAAHHLHRLDTDWHGAALELGAEYATGALCHRGGDGSRAEDAGGHDDDAIKCLRD